MSQKEPLSFIGKRLFDFAASGLLLAQAFHIPRPADTSGIEFLLSTQMVA
jgi:hypothetical protein